MSGVAPIQNGTLHEIQDKDNYIAALPGYNVDPLWKSTTVVPRKPSPAASTVLWKYSDLRPLMLSAARLINGQEAQRRVLILTNPTMRPPYTTDTITCGLQVIKPGETAAPHRHLAFAIRFIIEGAAGFTSIDGERIPMETGDLVLTPSWTWHDHGLDGREPMIWLDANDLSMYQKLPVHFAENYPAPVYETKPMDNSDAFRFPWTKMKAQLDITDADYVTQTYRKPDGSHVSNTLGAHALRLKASKGSTPIRTTCSFVFHCQSGAGKTKVEDANGKVDILCWTRQDTFAVPAWSKITHTAESSEDAYIFSLSDMPLLENLNMYKVE